MELDRWYKTNENDKIWWYDNSDKVIGIFLFSFDRKKVYNLFRDYPFELNKQEKIIFKKEQPFWADFFKDREEWLKEKRRK